MQRRQVSCSWEKTHFILKCLLWQLTSCNWQNSFALLRLIFLKMKLLKGSLQNKRRLWQQQKKLVFVKVCMSRDSKKKHPLLLFCKLFCFHYQEGNEDSKNTNGKGKHFISHSRVWITWQLLEYCWDLPVRVTLRDSCHTDQITNLQIHKSVQSNWTFSYNS